jgi:uncharacterized protein involved in tolerance to divalent cations
MFLSTLFILVIISFLPDSSSYKTNFNRLIHSYEYKLNFKTLKSSTSEIESVSNSNTDMKIPQILSFIEPKTNICIKLIGSMHYNPVSIQLVKNEIEKCVVDNSLLAVLIESCPTRWNQSQNSTSKSMNWISDIVFNNEMKTAYKTANQYSIPTILGNKLHVFYIVNIH